MAHRGWAPASPAAARDPASNLSLPLCSWYSRLSPAKGWASAQLVPAPFLPLARLEADSRLPRGRSLRLFPHRLGCLISRRSNSSEQARQPLPFAPARSEHRPYRKVQSPAATACASAQPRNLARRYRPSPPEPSPPDFGVPPLVAPGG